MSAAANYSLPTGIVGLSGPVKKPAPGTLPLRGDLAHVALAGHYLAAHYVIPMARQLASGDATLKLMPRDDADEGATLPGHSAVELLDCEGDWAWITVGPEGPSGYVRMNALAKADVA